MNPFFRTLLAAAGLLLVMHATAAEPAARIVKQIDPAHSTGIRIGDIMQRTVVLETSSPYQLSRSALPMKGANRDGIELAELIIEEQKKVDVTRYAVTLRYQVFAHAAAPAIMTLPEETFALTGGPQGLSLKVPAWRFWYSPLALADISTAKGNMQPQFAPATIDTEPHRLRLIAFLSLLVISGLTMAYLNADARWLPFMNGPFARAHRRIRRLNAKDGEAWKPALAALHEAFNTVNDSNLFAADIGNFVERHPRFARARAEIETFFAQSGQALFSQPPQDGETFVKQLATLSKHLRDCERGAA